MQPTVILNHQQVLQKLNRMVYQIIENFYLEKEVVLAGIAGQGYILTGLIAEKLKPVAPFTIRMAELKIDKKNPFGKDAVIPFGPEELEGKCVLVIDDVLNSGKTLMFGVKQFMHIPLKRLATLVLVDRNHKRYPVNADFSGITLATTLQQNIKVNFEAENYQVTLQ